MKLILAGCFALLFLSSCQEDEPSPDCDTTATVRDLSGVDGCGWVLELENGEFLEFYLPTAVGWCGTPPYPDSQPREIAYHSPWNNVTPQDGMKVRVAYDVLEDYASVCMVGKIVQITCLEIVESPESDQPIR